jgi:hypothetical protein
MKVSVTGGGQVWNDYSTPDTGRAVIVQDIFDREYFCVTRALYHEGEFVTLGMGGRHEADMPCIFRLDVGHLGGCKWRYAREGESLTIAA